MLCVCVCVSFSTQLPEDLNALWAFLTFYGGECQLNLNKKVTHLVVKEPKGVSARSASCLQQNIGGKVLVLLSAGKSLKIQIGTGSKVGAS